MVVCVNGVGVKWCFSEASDWLTTRKETRVKRNQLRMHNSLQGRGTRYYPIIPYAPYPLVHSMFPSWHWQPWTLFCLQSTLFYCRLGLIDTGLTCHSRPLFSLGALLLRRKLLLLYIFSGCKNKSVLQPPLLVTFSKHLFV